MNQLFSLTKASFYLTNQLDFGGMIADLYCRFYLCRWETPLNFHEMQYDKNMRMIT
jgi:hypothetical protein